MYGGYPGTKFTTEIKSMNSRQWFDEMKPISYIPYMEAGTKGDTEEFLAKINHLWTVTENVFYSNQKLLLGENLK